MRASTQLSFGINVLLAIQLLTTFAAVALLARMSPAVGQILQDNVASLVASEQMLHDLSADDPEGFRQALAQAQANLTEAEETAQLAVLAQRADAAFAGDRAAADDVRAAAVALSEINRASMQRADQAALWLGQAGAWAMVVLGVAGFLASFAIARRAEQNVASPVSELADTIARAMAGDVHRRATLSTAPTEFTEMARGLNQLLDERTRHRAPAPSSGATPRAALLALLDAQADPTVVLDPNGAIAAANQAAEDLLLGPDGATWKERLAHGDGVRRAPLPADAGALCTLVREVADG